MTHSQEFKQKSDKVTAFKNTFAPNKQKATKGLIRH